MLRKWESDATASEKLDALTRARVSARRGVGGLSIEVSREPVSPETLNDEFRCCGLRRIPEPADPMPEAANKQRCAVSDTSQQSRPLAMVSFRTAF